MKVKRLKLKTKTNKKQFTKIYYPTKHRAGIQEIELDTTLKYEQLPEMILHVSNVNYGTNYGTITQYLLKSDHYASYDEAFKVYVDMQLKAIKDATIALQGVGVM